MTSALYRDDRDSLASTPLEMTERGAITPISGTGA